MRTRQQLFKLGLINSHGWPRQPMAEEAEPFARPVADKWALGHGAATFQTYLDRLVGEA
jgi:hypothetical protein